MRIFTATDKNDNGYKYTKEFSAIDFETMTAEPTSACAAGVVFPTPNSTMHKFT